MSPLTDKCPLTILGLVQRCLNQCLLVHMCMKEQPLTLFSVSISQNIVINVILLQSEGIVLYHRRNVTRALYLEVWCGQHQASSLPYPQQRLRLPHIILARWCFVKMGWVNGIILRQITDTSVLIRCPLKWCMVGILTQGHSFFSTVYNTLFSHHVAHFQSTCMGPNDDIQWLNLSLCFDAEWTV